MQGPFISNDNFTLNTIKLYRHNYPNVKLILSTWKIPNEVKEELKIIDVHSIENIKPNNPGLSNINLQIVSSSSGIIAAKKLNVKYVLKTRTDQRIYHPSMDFYLFNLIKSFPLTSHNYNQIKRLVGISLGTFKYRMYGVSDMFLYGHIDDMVDYWSPPLEDRQCTDEEAADAVKTWRKICSFLCCRCVLMYNIPKENWSRYQFYIKR